jgi:hypothetical protein
VKGNQNASAIVIVIVMATNDAVVNDFPLGFVLAYPHSGFIQRPALFWRFSLL